MGNSAISLQKKKNDTNLPAWLCSRHYAFHNSVSLTRLQFVILNSRQLGQASLLYVKFPDYCHSTHQVTQSYFGLKPKLGAQNWIPTSILVCIIPEPNSVFQILLNLPCQFFSNRFWQASDCHTSGNVHYIYSNINSSTFKILYLPVKEIAFSPTFLIQQQAAAKYNNQHSLKQQSNQLI